MGGGGGGAGGGRTAHREMGKKRKERLKKL